MGDLVVTCWQAATPIWLAALGSVIAQRSGVVHLGLEGLMLTGAFVTTAILIQSGSLVGGLVAALVVNLLLSSLFWVVITHLGGSQIMVGLGLSLTAAGATGYLLVLSFGSLSAIQAPKGLPRPLAGSTGLLQPFSRLSILSLLVIVISGGVWWFLRRTRSGLKLAACGSDPFAARSAGVDVQRYRLGAVLGTGTLCTLAGAELALGSVQAFANNMVGGRGYVAFAAMLLGGVSALGASLAAVFFGTAEGLGIQTQVMLDLAVAPQFIQMLPYIATVIAISVAAYLRRRRGEDGVTILERTT
jgi:general nucleoside transport system permease protein